MDSNHQRNVLFVDDEPDILLALEDSLEMSGKEWQMLFANGGEKALKILDRKPIQILVSDLQMPGMDGAQLLAETRRRHPETARVIMSGFYDKETALRLVCGTHQYLPKPCNTDLLAATISRIFRLRDLLSSETLQRLVARIKSLPSPPTTYSELMKEVEKEEADVDKIGSIISRDPSMSAKILQLVNSAYFGLPREISHPSEATVFLGVDLIRGLVLMAHVFSQFDEVRMETFSIERLMEHSWLTGIIVRELAQAEGLEKRMCDHAFLAGLLHDLGKLILAANLPQLYQEVLRTSINSSTTLMDAEADLLGCSHGELGAYLLGLWGLPDQVVEAVAFHSQPADETTSGANLRDIATLVFAASEFEKIKNAPNGLAAIPPSAKQILEWTGATPRLEEWWARARGVLNSD